MEPYDRYPPKPMNLDDHDVLEAPFPARRIRRLTERAKAMLEDESPEGDGELLLDNSETLEDPQTFPEELPRPPLQIRICRLVKTAVNKFGLTRVYHGRPSGTPKLQMSDFLTDREWHRFGCRFAGVQVQVQNPNPQPNLYPWRRVGVGGKDNFK